MKTLSNKIFVNLPNEIFVKSQNENLIYQIKWC